MKHIYDKLLNINDHMDDPLVKQVVALSPDPCRFYNVPLSSSSYRSYLKSTDMTILDGEMAWQAANDLFRYVLKVSHPIQVQLRYRYERTQLVRLLKQHYKDKDLLVCPRIYSGSSREFEILPFVFFADMDCFESFLTWWKLTHWGSFDSFDQALDALNQTLNALGNKSPVSVRVEM